MGPERYKIVIIKDNDKAEGEEVYEIKMWYPTKGYWNASL